MKNFLVIAVVFWLLFMNGITAVKQWTSGPIPATIVTGAQAALTPPTPAPSPTAAPVPTARITLPVVPQVAVRAPVYTAAAPASEPYVAEPATPAPLATAEPGGLDIHVGSDGVQASIRSDPTQPPAPLQPIIEDPGRQMMPTIGPPPTYMQQSEYAANDGTGFSPECVALHDKYKDKRDNSIIPTDDFRGLIRCNQVGHL